MAQTITVLVIDPVNGASVETIPKGHIGLGLAVSGTKEGATFTLVPHKLGPGLDLWADDDGLSKSLPVNYWSGFIAKYGPVVGRMVVTRSQGEHTVSLTTSDLERLNRLLPPKPEARIEVVSWDDPMER